MSIITVTFDISQPHSVQGWIVLLKKTMLGDLNKTQINNLLGGQVVGRLGYIDGKHPCIVPVTYVYDGEYIYGQSNEGTKLKILRENPNVCFEVDVMTSMRNWQSVIATGTFQELDGEAAKAAGTVLFSRVFELMTSSTVHAHEHEINGVLDDSNRVKSVMYRIKIESVTGRFEKE